MVEFLRQYRKNVIAVGVLIIVLIVLFLVQSFLKKEDPKKDMQNHDYVFTMESTQTKDGIARSMLPQINLASDNISSQNEEIMNLYYNIINGNKNSFTYEYVVKDTLLFLLIKINYYEPLNAGMETRYISYINDLETKELVTNEEVLQRFGFEENADEKVITNKMKKYYTDAVSKGLVEGNLCDFECYMEWKDMTDIKVGTSLFVKNDKLVVYRGFTLKSVYADDILYDKKEPFLFEMEV